MSKSHRWLVTILWSLALVVLTGCATTPAEPGAQDPFEKANRSILNFNLKADRVVFKPVARAYTRIIPGPVRKGVNNFFSNLWEPMTVVNDLLQGKIAYAVKDTSRFVVNSTVGIFGIFDVAKKIDLPRHREDFGQTLAVWGVPSGPYLVLPFLGPSNLRDTTGLIPQYVFTDATAKMNSSESLYVSGVRIVDKRAQLLGMDDILELQPDQYLFLRESYRQARMSAVYDGRPPQAEGDESEQGLIDQLLEDE